LQSAFKGSGNLLSRWLTLPPEASLFVRFIFAPALISGLDRQAFLMNTDLVQGLIAFFL
jgi:hypothetical protein